MAFLTQLYELQELDWARAERQAGLAEVRVALAGDARLMAAQGRLRQISARHTQQNALWQQAQRATQDLESRLSSLDSRLYGGGITNLRELEAAQEERVALQARISESEDTLLERMIAAEELQEELEAARREVSELEAAREEALPGLRAREEALFGELAALDTRRLEMIPTIPPRMLALYESLLSSRGGHAVSRVDAGRGMCQACRIALPQSDMRRVRNDEGVVQCNNCRRILYLE